MIFRNWVLENFPFLEDDFDALTDYELFCKMVEYMKESLKKVKDFQEQIDLFTVKLDEFQHYFDNLDVQEEINNKLDEMAENGELTDIIAQYLQLAGILIFNNVDDLIDAENLANGSFAQTSGFHDYNDGGGALYKIRTIVNTDVVNDYNLFALTNYNNLVAEFIPSDKINVKQFGAYGDNTHDDTETIQACVDYCQDNHFTMYIPTGNYKLTDAIDVVGCCIEGNFKNTYLYLNNCDGLHLSPYLSQTVCEIKGLSFYSNDAENYLELCGVDILKSDDANRSRGYNIHECYFENLGCAIEVNDCFRTTIKDININNCFRALFIKNQTVQSYFNNIISNCDLTAGLSSTRYGSRPIGIQIGEVGFTQRCEGIKIEACCMTNHEVGLYLYDGLFVNILGCELDLCRKEGMIINSHEGNCNVKDNWIVSQSTTDESIIDIRTPNTSKYRLNIINNLIGCIQGHASKMGISIGRTSALYYKSNVYIVGNTIKNFNNATPLDYGIYVDRGRYCVINDNSVLGCTTADIFFAPDRQGTLNNNLVDTLKFTIYAGSTMWGYSNMAGTVTKAIGGTYVGDIT